MSRTRRSSSLPTCPTLRSSAGGDPRPVVVARGPGDLLAAVPHLLGFRPKNSLVLISLRGPRSRFGLIARVDLPGGELPGGERDGGSPDGAYVSRCVEFVLRDRPRQVALVVYGASAWSRTQPPWGSLVREVRADLVAHDVPVLSALYVGEERYGDYDCVGDSCCPADGHPLTELDCSAVAATFVAGGSAPLPDRDALDDLIAPASTERCTRVERAAREELSRVGSVWQKDDDDRWTGWQAGSLRLLSTLADRYRAGSRGLSAAEAGRLVAGLCDVATRDAAAIGWTAWESGWRDGTRGPAFPGAEGPLARLLGQVPPPEARFGKGVHEEGEEEVDGDAADAELAEAVRRRVDVSTMWRDLATACDGTLALAPLVLLAMHEWSCGRGAQAAVAVARARQIDPDYRMARLMDRVLSLGLAPASVSSE